MRSGAGYDQAAAGLDGLEPFEWRSIRRQFAIGLRKEAAELLAGPPKPALYGAYAYPEPPGYVSVGLVRSVAQHEYLALTRAKPVHARVHERGELADRRLAERVRSVARDRIGDGRQIVTAEGAVERQGGMPSAIGIVFAPV